MTLTCPRCRRTLADSANPAEPPQFCMYCGQKLRSADGPPVAAGPAPAPGIDEPTLAYAPTPPGADETATHTPGDPAAGTDGPPTEVGGFRLVRFIGAGGMGSVYEAEHDETGHRVAIKLLSGRLASNPVSVERFKQEGRVASQITHPHCVFVLGADTDAGRPYIVMELMPGRTLKDLVDRNGPFPVGEAVDRILDVIDGLAEAHRLGVIHRDVKPSNCFLTDDNRVKVGDFGLSKSLAADPGGRQITQSGAFLGTVLFASPEQIRGEPVGYESDVYAVCGTLYYLLTGRAPYQHESLTASLAKAVSEPPPPIRAKRPDVSAELERIILRGLDRDRDRRWQSLEDLRDALRDQQPERQLPARPRALVMAYLTDALILGALGLVLGLVRELAFNLPDSASERFIEVGWQDFVLTVLYFGLFEGLLGWTPGKRLLRLRVARIGQTGPPGVGRAMLRAFVFNTIWYSVFIFPQQLFLMASQPAGTLLALATATAGLVALLRQLWKSADGWRGLHDFASDCRVVQRPRLGYRLRLVSRYPNPLTRFQPTPAPLPGSVGGFAVTGKLCGLPDGGEVWVGEDKSLGRRVVIRVMPPGRDDPIETDVPVTRPTRLRVVGHGTLVWEGSERGWVASVAPAGAPLVNIAGPSHRLNWAETRPILEQLTTELEQAEADGSGIGRPSLPQVWVEPGGRLQLLDFPIPCGQEPVEAKAEKGKSRYGMAPAPYVPAPVADAPMDFVRQVTALALEGRPRIGGGRIKAPLPPHASRITDRLFAGAYKTPGQLTTELIDNHLHPPLVTAGPRAAHLGAQAAMLAVGLAMMFLMSGLYTWSMVYSTAQTAETAARIRDIAHDPAAREVLLERARGEADRGPSARLMTELLTTALAPDKLPETLRHLDEWTARRRAKVEDQKQYLTRPELFLLEQSVRLNEVNAPDPEEISPTTAGALIQLASSPRAVSGPDDLKGIVFGFIVLVVIWPLIWMAFAFAFRGGISMSLAGLTLVRSDGRLAGRFRCAVRELLVWLPIVAVLVLSLWVQAVAPERVFLRTFLWLIGLLLLPTYVMLALRDPSRPPHDRIMGTHIVPA